jgi:hypothetical protein
MAHKPTEDDKRKLQAIAHAWRELADDAAKAAAARTDSVGGKSHRSRNAGSGEPLGLMRISVIAWLLLSTVMSLAQQRAPDKPTPSAPSGAQSKRASPPTGGAGIDLQGSSTRDIPMGKGKQPKSDAAPGGGKSAR